MFTTQTTKIYNDDKATVETTPHIPLPGLQISSINQYIISLLPHKDAVNFARTSRFIRLSTFREISLRKQILLSHSIIVEPNEDKVKKFLDENPHLINTVLPVIVNNSGIRLINNTVLQLAYGAGDYMMCAVIIPFFFKVYGSQSAATHQIRKQLLAKFAEREGFYDWKELEVKRWLDELLKPVISAIKLEDFDQGVNANNKLILKPETIAAIQTFREKFARLQPKTIRKGMHFCIGILHHVYLTNFEMLRYRNSADIKRHALFEDAVSSVVLSAVPAHIAQRCSQGLFKLQRFLKHSSEEDTICESERPIRSLTLRDSKKTHFYRSLGDHSFQFELTGSCVDICVGVSGNEVKFLNGKGNSHGLGGAHHLTRALSMAERKEMLQICNIILEKPNFIQVNSHKLFKLSPKMQTNRLEAASIDKETKTLHIRACL